MTLRGSATIVVFSLQDQGDTPWSFASCCVSLREASAYSLFGYLDPYFSRYSLQFRIQCIF